MKKLNLYNTLMIKASKRPFKTIRLTSGVLVDHYRNGSIKANRTASDKRVIFEVVSHG